MNQYLNTLLLRKSSFIDCTRIFKRITVCLFLFTLLQSPLVKAQNTKIPAPEEVLGFKVGADFKLATYEQSIAYFKKLDEASDLLQMVYVGETSEGKPWYFAMITSPENSKNINKYKDITQKLAHPGNLTKEEAKKLVKEGKPIVHIDGGLHASEVAGAQHTISLAYQL